MISLKNWRLNWTINQIFTFSNYKRHKAVLNSSSLYWIALIIKFFPNLYKHPILLRLKNGGTISIVDFMSLYIYNEIFIEGGYDYPSLKKKDPVIIDIGANTGLFTLRMKQLYPDATIFCYEPYDINFKQLEENIALSNLNNVSVFQQGVGGIARTEKLYINKKNLGGHSLFKLEARSDDYINIDITGIESILNNLSLMHCDLIKMDCEGAEYEIIKAISPELASRIKTIVFESTESVYNLDELLKHLNDLGYKVEFKEKSCNYIASK